VQAFANWEGKDLQSALTFVLDKTTREGGIVWEVLPQATPMMLAAAVSMKRTYYAFNENSTSCYINAWEKQGEVTANVTAAAARWQQLIKDTRVRAHCKEKNKVYPGKILHVNDDDTFLVEFACDKTVYENCARSDIEKTPDLSAARRVKVSTHARTHARTHTCTHTYTHTCQVLHAMASTVKPEDVERVRLAFAFVNEHSQAKTQLF